MANGDDKTFVPEDQETIRSMGKWLLKVQVCGEWEECAFGTQQEALKTFAALTEDYSAKIERAILLREFASPRKEYIN